MSCRNPRRLLLSLTLFVAGAALGACAEMDGTAPEDGADPSLALDVTDDDPAAITDEMAAMDPAPSCPGKQYTFQGDDAVALMTGRRTIDPGTGEIWEVPEGGAEKQCGCDLYFHPNNGAHGGYIEGWRVCHVSGSTWQICTGGYAPVRFWNAASCGGTVHDWYPQGWHGWGQTVKCCC